MSDVNGLGVYLLCSLGFVFSALVEFTIIITLKRRAMNRKVGMKSKQQIKTRRITDAGRECKNLDTFNVTTAKYKRSKSEQRSDAENKSMVEEVDMALLRKIDIISFLVYLSGYILFNCYYWVNMITRE